MVKALWSKFKNKVQIDVELNRWELSYSEQDIKDRIQYRLADAVANEITKMITHEIDQEVVKRLAQELLASYDYKEAVQKVMHERLQNYLRNI